MKVENVLTYTIILAYEYIQTKNKRSKKISDCYSLESLVKVTVYNLRNHTIQWQNSKPT